MIHTLKNTDEFLNFLVQEGNFKLLESLNDISVLFLDKDDNRLQAAYDIKRQQCNAEVLLDYLSKSLSSSIRKKELFFTDVDIYRPEAEFIFGLSKNRGAQVAVVSIYRLKIQSEELFLSRFLKEALHELGHLFCLGHCRDKFCVMSLSLDIKDVDYKKTRFCRNCRKLLER